MIEKTLYIFGGNSGKEWLNDLYAFNTDTKIWKKISADGPSPRGFCGSTAVKSQFLVLGGDSDGGALNQLWGFDSSK